MGFKIYYDSLSQPSRALLLLTRVNNIPHEEIPISIQAGENRDDEFSKINPFQKLPVIDHDGFILTESVAILRYICRTFPVADYWYPRSSHEMARVDEYMAWQHATLRTNCAMYFMGHFFPVMITGSAPDPQKISRFRKSMETSLNQMENIWLKNKLFVAGNHITIADLLAVTELEQPGMVGYDIREGRPILSAYMDRVKSHLNPHYDQVHAAVNQTKQKYQSEISQIKSKI